MWYERLCWQNRILYQGFRILTEFNSKKCYGKLYKVYVVTSCIDKKEYIFIAVDVYQDVTELENTRLIKYVEENIQQMYFVLTPSYNTSCAKILQLLHTYDDKINLWI